MGRKIRRDREILAVNLSVIFYFSSERQMVSYPVPSLIYWQQLPKTQHWTVFMGNDVPDVTSKQRNVCWESSIPLVEEKFEGLQRIVHSYLVTRYLDSVRVKITANTDLWFSILLCYHLSARAKGIWAVGWDEQALGERIFLSMSYMQSSLHSSHLILITNYFCYR